MAPINSGDHFLTAGNGNKTDQFLFRKSSDVMYIEDMTSPDQTATLGIMEMSLDGRRMVIGNTSATGVSLHLYSIIKGVTTLHDSIAIPNGINSVSLSADGRYLAVALKAGGFTIMDLSLNTLTAIYTWDGASLGNVKAIGLSPDSKILVVGYSISPYMTAHKMDISETATVTLTKIADYATISNPSCITWTPDGNNFIVTHTNSPYATLFKAFDGTIASVQTLSTTVTPTKAKFSPYGDFLVLTGATSPYLHVFKRNSSNIMSSFTTYPTLAGNAEGVDFSVDGTEFAVVKGITTNSVTVIRINESSITQTRQFSTVAPAKSVMFTKDNRSLLVGLDMSQYINGFSRNGEYETIRTTAKVNTARQIENTPAYYAKDRDIRIFTKPLSIVNKVAFNLPTKIDTSGLTNTCNAIAFSPDGKYVVLGHDSSPQIIAMSISDNGFVKVGEFILPGQCKTIEFSPDGLYLSVGYTVAPYFSVFNFNHGMIWKLGDYNVGGICYSSSWSPDSQYIITAHVGLPGYSLIKKDTNTLIRTATYNNSTYTANNGRVTFSPDGQYIAAVANVAAPVLLMKKNSETSLTKASEYGAAVASNVIEFSPNGKYLVVDRASTQTLDVLRRDDATMFKIAEYGGMGNVASISWSPDGEHLAVSQNGVDSNVIILNVKGESVSNIYQYAVNASIPTVRFSPGGNCLLVGSTVYPYVFTLNGAVSPITTETPPQIITMPDGTKFALIE